MGWATGCMICWFKSICNRSRWVIFLGTLRLLPGEKSRFLSPRRKKRFLARKGRPGRGEIREPKPESRLVRQVGQEVEEPLKEIPVVCDVVVKFQVPRISKGVSDSGAASEARPHSDFDSPQVFGFAGRRGSQVVPIFHTSRSAGDWLICMVCAL